MTKISVALVAYDRPQYLERCLEALLGCRDLSTLVDEVYASVDGPPSDKTQACRSLIEKKSIEFLAKGIHVHAAQQESRKGIVGNSALTLMRAFEGRAEHVLYLEDDAVLKPDALLLGRWFWNLSNIYLAMGLSCHKEDKHQANPSEILEKNFLPCPFAYFVRRQHWPFILRNWCKKSYHPCGWSWSMTFAARGRGYRFLSPALSRVENIGREGGTNETPETWDSSQTGICFSDGYYSGEYGISDKMTEEKSKEVSPWMQAEIDQNPKALFDRWVGFEPVPRILEAQKKLEAEQIALKLPREDVIRASIALSQEEKEDLNLSIVGEILCPSALILEPEERHVLLLEKAGIDRWRDLLLPA